VFRGEVTAHDGTPVQTLFLADTGADRTVLSANILTALGPLPALMTQQLGGVGGKATAVIVDTAIHLARDDGGTALFRGSFAAFTDAEALDMSVLGREITNLFALIVDRPREIVCLLGQDHDYTIARRELMR
jgi:hypothetical protein